MNELLSHGQNLTRVCLLNFRSLHGTKNITKKNENRQARKKTEIKPQLVTTVYNDVITNGDCSVRNNDGCCSGVLCCDGLVVQVWLPDVPGTCRFIISEHTGMGCHSGVIDVRILPAVRTPVLISRDNTTRVTRICHRTGHEQF